MDGRQIVLLVDDDPVFLKMAGEVLKDDYTVSLARSGSEMLKLVSKALVPDIILLDVDMPDLDGFEALKRFRSIENMQDIPVIFLTGVGQPEDELRGFCSGAVDYVKKPFVREILLARIRIHLENAGKIKRLGTLEKNRRESLIDEEKYLRHSLGLSETEKRILRLIALGYTNQEIAEELSYSYHYVKKVVNIIYEKKYVNKRSDLKKLLQ